MIKRFVYNLGLTSSTSKNKNIILKLPGKKYQGSSRIVYAINDNWVIKVAKNEDGLIQNKKEVIVYATASSYERRFLCEIKLSAPDFTWIIQRRVVRKLRKYNNMTEKIGSILYNRCEYVFFNSGCLRDSAQIGFIKNKKTPKFYDYGY